MRQSLPATFLQRTAAKDTEDDISRFRGTTIAERARVLESLCQMAAEFIAQHEDPQRALEWQDRCSPETEALLARLRKRYQHGD
jgi:hypothetical protein